MGDGERPLDAGCSCWLLTDTAASPGFGMAVIPALGIPGTCRLPRGER